MASVSVFQVTVARLRKLITECEGLWSIVYRRWEPV